ncbi:MAG: hypothetical protein COV29_00895 [Candidatus Yanofskybacteria bacterium CG10_big_fil_rev_8_21_14_0_10_36_16]|uniref:Uncharacterized protein n=1 Tax=Candidatus Yanofskybacteria bacterium CG10_big_fil_rev_8_21_14_0_10_36_16 TaxID=1975096 RepID=A0A2J0Q839_9BACT|nr:MAG: hypothetical protein COV29_00895 [Candidatus Yanofskybacteria bacterium CG10_big_fil_rev_8_21_14_0_10_36_16]
MPRILFWTNDEDSNAQSVNLSKKADELLQNIAQRAQRRVVDILREVYELYEGEVNEENLFQYLTSGTSVN